MSDLTPLKLPGDLPYPITITRISVDKGTKVRRGDRMLEYSFMSATRRKELDKMEREGKEAPAKLRQNDMVGSWESPIDGEVKRWDSAVKPGATFERRHARCVQ
jgi:RNA polymerase II subunit A-like phosphatase